MKKFFQNLRKKGKPNDSQAADAAGTRAGQPPGGQTGGRGQGAVGAGASGGSAGPGGSEKEVLVRVHFTEEGELLEVLLQATSNP